MDLILAQYKQRLQNNILHGEQVRYRNAHEGVREIGYSLIHPNYDRIWGPDISHWDGNVTLSKTKSLGAAFVFIKALDGTLSTRNFIANRARALEAGLFHAPYSWLYANVNVSCVLQARAYSDLLALYPSELPPVIDFEWTRFAGRMSNPNYSDLSVWVREFRRLGNRKPSLYSAAGYMNTIGTIPTELKEQFEGIWIANYGVTQPMMPRGYGEDEWLFHQFTASGDAVNITPNDAGKLEVDLNYYNGTFETLARLAGREDVPTPEEPDLVIIEKGKPPRRFQELP